MALAQVYTAVAGHIITAARWNNEFGNVYANGTDLCFPLTKAVSLSGYTLTLDSAGVTTLGSNSTQGFVLTPGVKSGTPGTNGSFVNLVAATFTDTNTSVGGTAAVWNGTTFRAPTLSASNTAVVTTNAATVFIEAGPTAGTNETLTNAWALSLGGSLKIAGNLTLSGDQTFTTSDARTTTVDAPLTLTSTTSGSPAAGIGTGLLFQAESADESPSDFGQVEFAASDVGSGTEDTYFQVLLRVAGAALVACWRWAATGAFKGIITHANTADRTYTFPDRSFTYGAGDVYMGPSSTGSVSTAAHEGTATIAASQALSGVHFYTNFTLDAGQTLTIADDAGRLCIVATGTITINGTIDGIGAGGQGGTVGTVASPTDGRAGGSGTAQPGGGGGGGTSNAGGDGGSGGPAHGGRGGDVGVSGAQGPNNTGELIGLAHPLGILGGGGGGAGGNGAANAGAVGGNGGASIVLCAPAVVLGAASVLNTSGANGGNGGNNAQGSGGGGSAGNVYVFCSSYTNNGATFTATAGAAGTGGAGTAANGAAGRAGLRQINIYA